MATTIDRTNYNLLVDDTGGVIPDGTNWNKNQVKIVLLDAIDAMFASAFVFGGSVSVPSLTVTTGPLTVTGASVTVTASVAAEVGVAIRNTLSNAAAYSSVNLGNNLAAARGSIAMTSSTYTPSIFYRADAIVFTTSGLGGISIAASDAAGIVAIYTGGTTETARFHASRGVSIGTVTDPGAKNLLVDGSIKTTSGDVTLGVDRFLYVSHLGSAPSGNYELTRLFYSGHDVLLQQIVGGTGVAGDFFIATIGGRKLILGGGSTSIQLNGYGAGTLVTDASGNVTASSDERMKDIQGPFTTGLNAILNLRPILYTHKDAFGLDPTCVMAGFSAQQMLPHIPEAVGMDPQGYYTLSDRPILAACVNAIQDLQRQISELRNT